MSHKCPANNESCPGCLMLYQVFHDELAHIATLKGLANLLLKERPQDDATYDQYATLIKREADALDKRIKERLHQLDDLI